MLDKDFNLDAEFEKARKNYLSKRNGIVHIPSTLSRNNDKIAYITEQDWRKSGTELSSSLLEAIQDLREHEQEEFTRLRSLGFFENALVHRYYNNHFLKGPIRNPRDIKGFQGEQYWHVQNFPGARFGRFESLMGLLYGTPGAWWTRLDSMPQSQMQGMLDSAVVSDWNTFSVLAVMEIAPGKRVDMFEGEAGPQSNYKSEIIRKLGNTEYKWEKFAGSGYVGGGNQLLLTPESARSVVMSPHYYRFFLINWNDTNNTILTLRHRMVKGRASIDLSQLKRYAPSLFAELKEAAKKKRIPLW